MPNTVVNYDGGITASPRQLIYPETVEQIQAVLRDQNQYPSPVRAVGSYHSLTPCASSDGTMLNMSKMNRIVKLDTAKGVFTAQAGLQFIEASRALRKSEMQFMTNIEIGNMTLGSAACCQTKDALDGVELGQVNSYVTAMKWVTPSGELAEASEESNPELMRKMRASYGLAGVVYEVTFRVKPLEAIHLTYLPRPLEELTQKEVDDLMDSSEGLICWTINRTCVFQQRRKVEERHILGPLKAAARQGLWNFGEAYAGHLIHEFARDRKVRDRLQNALFDANLFLYHTLRVFGGITILAPDKTIDYSKTPQDARYAFTFWAFPRGQWLETLKGYVQFAEAYFQDTGFRCNMPLGAYHIHKDQKSLLSYTHDEECFSIDPIHAPTDVKAWHRFLAHFNDWASERNGIPLLNQSPLVTREQCEKAYGARWQEFSNFVREADPEGRMMNEFFGGLVAQRAAHA